MSKDVTALVWEAGGTIVGRRFYVALILRCKDEEGCLKKAKEGKRLFSETGVDEKPIITWSDYFEGIVLCARHPLEESRVSRFCEAVKGSFGEEACLRLSRPPDGIAVGQTE